MGSAKIITKEIDLSTRVPSFPGLYNAIVLASPRGSTDEGTLVTNETELLSYFTPNDRVEVGYDMGFFSAIQTVTQTNKLWVFRAHNNALYGGARFVVDGSYEEVTEALQDTVSGTLVYSGIISNIPIEPSTVTVTIASLTITATDDGLGVISGTGISGTVDYETGAYELTLDTDPLGAYTISCTYGASNTNTGLIEGLLDPTDYVFNQEILPSVEQTASGTTVYGGTFDKFPVEVGSLTISIPDLNITGEDDGAGVITGTGITGTIVYATGVWSITIDDPLAVYDIRATYTYANNQECMILYGVDQGAYNDDISIQLYNYTDSPDLVKEEDSFLVQVFKGTSTVPVETFTCSRKQDKIDGYGRNIYVEDILTSSQWIRGRNNPLVDENILPREQTFDLDFTGGSDGGTVTSANRITALEKLLDKEKYPVTVILDGGETATEYKEKIEEVARLRGDCLGVLSVPYAMEADSAYMNSVLNYKKNTLNALNSSSYVALYTPHLQIYDKFNDRRIWVPPDGHVAAAISNTASNYEAWYPVAGWRRGVVNVLDVRRQYTEGERDALYDAGINPFRYQSNRGIAIWGQKTMLSRPSTFDRLNVRLLLCVIKPAMASALEDFLFEINDVLTRSTVTALLGEYLDTIVATRGIYDYRVVCNDQNNLPNDIDNHKLNVWVFIKPTISIEEIPFSLIVTRTGYDFKLAEGLVGVI